MLRRIAISEMKTKKKKKKKEKRCLGIKALATKVGKELVCIHRLSYDITGRKQNHVIKI